MKRIAVIIPTLALMLIGFTGCAEKEKARQETTIKTPEGKTTVTTEKEIKKTGKNPPEAP